MSASKPVTVGAIKVRKIGIMPRSYRDRTDAAAAKAEGRAQRTVTEDVVAVEFAGTPYKDLFTRAGAQRFLALVAAGPKAYAAIAEMAGRLPEHPTSSTQRRELSDAVDFS